MALSALAEGFVDVELMSPTDEFVYRRLLVAEPFGNADVGNGSPDRSLSVQRTDGCFLDSDAGGFEHTSDELT